MKELYKRLKQESSLPIILLPYIYKNFEKRLILDFMTLNFNHSEEYNLSEMKSIKDRYGDFFVEWYVPKK